MTRRSEQGFTLLEMMIALSIVGMMMFITWSVTASFTTGFIVPPVSRMLANFSICI